MEIDPHEVARYIASDGFPALGSDTEKDAALRGFLRANDAEFHALDPDAQDYVTGQLREQYEATRLGSLALYVPIIDGYVRGERAYERGDSLTVLAQGLANLAAKGDLTLRGPEGGGFEPRSASEQGILEALSAVGLAGLLLGLMVSVLEFSKKWLGLPYARFAANQGIRLRTVVCNSVRAYWVRDVPETQLDTSPDRSSGTVESQWGVARMNAAQRRIVSWTLLIGGPVTGFVWWWQYNFQQYHAFAPLVWTIATVCAALYVRAGGSSSGR